MDEDHSLDVAKEIDARIGPLRDELTMALGKATASIADLERRLAVAEQRLAVEARPSHEPERRGEHADVSVRRAGGPVATLDARDDELTALAAVARRGADLLARRLSDAEGAHLGTLAEAWSAWERARLARRMRALMLSRKLADGPIGDPGRHIDAEAFRAVTRELAGLDEGREATRAAAEDAARRLAEDQALRRDHDADVVAGEDADRRIRAIAGERVGEAVTRGELMPAWFESALPPSPAGAPQAGDDPRWLHVASSLVAYRILYGVDDPASAFGPDPADDWPRARREARSGLQQVVLFARGGSPHRREPRR